MALTVTSPPATEPVTLAEVKLWIRHGLASADTTEDAMLNELIQSAREDSVGWLWRQLVTATLKYTFDFFPASSIISLPMPPLITVTSVQYIDTAGDTQTFSSGSYTVDNESEPARIQLNEDATWPDTKNQINAVFITYTAGYGAAAAVPEWAKTLIKLLVGHYYVNREATSERTIKTVPITVQSIIEREGFKEF